MSEPNLVSVWPCKREVDVFITCNLFCLFGMKKTPNQTATNIQNCPPCLSQTSKAEIPFFYCFFKVEVSCAEEWQWLMCSPCMQLALAEQLADAEWKPALCCRARVYHRGGIKTSAHTGGTQGHVQVACEHSYLLDRLATVCSVPD